MKKIPVSSLTVGMYIQEICGSWMDHPFWKTSFPLNSEKDYQTILQSGVREVWIDPGKGLDVDDDTPSQDMEQAREQAEHLLNETQSLPPSDLRIPLKDEIERARFIHARAKNAVTSMFREVRMGHALSAEAAYPLVAEIHQSVARNSDALLNLARLKNKNDYTYLHSVAVCALMLALGKQLGMSGDDLLQAGTAGLLHDVGKMMIPDEILNKPGRLTDEEFNAIKSHPSLGHEILLNSGGLHPIVLDVCLHHHEKIDGTGYPEALSGDAVSLYARMGTVCDVYDAITSERCYKTGWEPAMAIRKMAEWQSSHFDLRIFHAFVRTVGIYPTGALVKLKSERLALVIEQHPTSLLTPLVRVFFSLRHNSHMEPKMLDLSTGEDSVAGAESPERWHFPASVLAL